MAPSPVVKLRALEVSNFKGIDHLKIEFPRPLSSFEPDAFVLGSGNGVGKTSVLEACAFLMLEHEGADVGTEEVIDAFIRAGFETAEVHGQLELGAKSKAFRVGLSRSGQIDSAKREWGFGPTQPEMVASLMGQRSAPLLMPPLLYFHSYRKVQEGRLELSEIVAGGRRLSAFKTEAVRALLGQGGVVEDPGNDGPRTVEKINELLARYAGGRLDKLRPASDNSLEIRIRPLDGAGSFSFDGLSSGQKEMISTMFLIWHHTKNQPGVVLIDEPELHLNAEWHSTIVRDLRKLQPLNQYILATHSEAVFGSVEESQRALLTSPVRALAR